MLKAIKQLPRMVASNLRFSKRKFQNLDANPLKAAWAMTASKVVHLFAWIPFMSNKILDDDDVCGIGSLSFEGKFYEFARDACRAHDGDFEALKAERVQGKRLIYRMRSMPKGEREEFEAWHLENIDGRPWIIGLPVDEQDGFWPEDYYRWRKEARGY